MIITKEIPLYGDSHKYINDLNAFGWKPTKVISKGKYTIQEVIPGYEPNGLYLGDFERKVQIMERDTEIPNYEEYCKLEADYEKAKKSIKYYDPIEISTLLLLFLLFIFPGICYILYKNNEKADIENHNKLCTSKMEQAVSAAQKIE